MPYEQQLKKKKMDYLVKNGFRQDSTSWTNGRRRVRSSLVNDAELPYCVFVNIVSKVIQESQAAKQTSKLKRRKTKRKSTKEFTKVDALDYRLPGSYGTGKRR
jgi:hypothetical protein